MAYNPIIIGGGTEAAAQRVTIANDSTGVLSVDDNGGSLTVDASSLPLPTGAATAAAQTDKSQFTKITDGTDTALVTAAGEVNVLATAQPGVDIGDVTINNETIAVTQSGTWDEVGINDSGNSITVDNTVLSVVGGGTEATAQRVTIASDSTGVLSVDDNGSTLSIDDGGGSITVDGSLTAAFPSGATDIFGMLKMSQQNNQIDIQFYRDTPQNLTTITTANSGTAVSSVGGALFSSGTNANGGVKSVTYTNVTYRGGSEIYAYFTAAFGPAGLANTYIRMGLYDTNNGAFVGFEGTSFYASYRNNGVDTQTVSGSFNGDTLTGAGGSNFTRGGSAEAVDFAKLNVYRIRFGWVGGAPIKYEILSPDGEWVTFHTLRFPNSSSGPSLRSADLPFTLDIQKTGAVGTNVQVTTGCWACGNTYHPSDQFVIGQGSQTALDQNVVLDVAGTASFDCYQFNSVSLEIVPAAGTVTAGAITFEGSNDNTNFVATTLYDDASPTANPVSTYTLAASTPRYFSGSIHYRYFRARISTGVTGTTTGVQCHSAFRLQNYTPQINTVQQATAANLNVTEASAAAIKTAVETLDNAISGSEMQVDVVAAIPTGTNTIGNVGVIQGGNVASVDTAGVDNESNTSTRLNTRTMVSWYDGTTWDRARGDATDGLLVNLGANNDVSLNAGTNAIGKLAANSGVDIGDVDVTSAVITGGAVAHDGADSGNPIKVGARATNVEIAAVANNDRSDLVTTLTGKLITFPFTNPENIVSGVTSAMTGTTSTSVVAAPAAGLRNYITQITVGNSHATVGTFVNIQDGSGGTTIWTIPAAAVYGGATINFDPPLKQPTTATALYCACVTTGSNTIVAANGFKAA